MTPRRIGLVVGLLALAFAAFGGEYSTLAWLELRSQATQERQAIGELEQSIDSLRHEAELLESDPQVQERVAREDFGMIREGEFIYFLVW